MSKKSGIIIDESTHRAVPTIFQRIWHSILATFFGAILAQVMLFAFKGGSLVLLINNYNVHRILDRLCDFRRCVWG